MEKQIAGNVVIDVYKTITGPREAARTEIIAVGVSRYEARSIMRGSCDMRSYMWAEERTLGVECGREMFDPEKKI